MTTSLRRFCFTDWCEPEQSELRVLEYCAKIEYRYLIIGKEICPNTGQFHLQGYCELERKTRFETIRKFVDGWHVEQAHGNSAQNKKYCSKDKDLALEDGTPATSQGKRVDLQEAVDCAQESGMRGVIRAGFGYQAFRYAEAALPYVEDARATKPEVIWIWGTTGYGKSRRARQLCGGNDYYVKNDETLWWPGYDGQQWIIIDDWRDTWWSISYFLNLIDRYGFRVQFKGGYRQCHGTYIVITCPNHPGTVYADAPMESKGQIMRRLDKVVHQDTHIWPDATIDEALFLEMTKHQYNAGGRQM